MQQIRVHGQHRAHGNFSWIIVGVPRDDGQVMVFASDTMSQAELEAVVYDDMSFLYSRDIFMPETTYTIRADVHSIVMAYGDTWANAIAKLFGIWKPPGDEHALLPAQTDE